MSDSATDFSYYFSNKYLFVWIGLMVIFEPIFFIWFPLQIYFFFFNWPKDQDSGSGNASGQIQHDWPISSLEDHNGERGPVERCRGRVVETDMMYDQRVTPSHTFLGKTFHWCFIILYAYGIFKQIDDISQLEDRGLLVFEVAFASVFLLIVILRYSYMRGFGTFIGAHEPVPKAHTFLARSIHVSMYLCLVLLPLSGLVIAGLFSLGIVEGQMQNIALLVHEFSADFSYLLIVVHILAALWSRIKGDGVWASMVPIFKEAGPSTNETVVTLSRMERHVFERAGEILSFTKE